MPSPADWHFLGADPALRDLPLLLDPAALVGMLRGVGAALPPGEVRLTYLRHKPGMSCLAGYEVDAVGTTHHFHAKTVTPDWTRKLLRMAAHGARPGSLGFGQCWLRSGLTLVRELPNDARLATLPALSDPDPWARLFGGPAASRARGRPTILKYKPERRLVARFGSGDACWVLKAYAPREWAQSAGAAVAFRSQGRVRLAPVLGVSGDTRCIAFGWLPGRLLTEVLAEGRFRQDDLEDVGAALAVLHGQPARLDRIRSTGEEAAELQRLAEALARLRPDSARAIRQLGMRLIRRLLATSPPVRPTHGDFYAQQVLLDGSGVGVLDFDEASLGDPASDLGNFLAHLERDVIRQRISPRVCALAWEHFLAGYRRVAPLPDGVALQTAVALFRVSHLPFRHREAGWAPQIDALLARVTELLGRIPLPAGAA